MAARKSARLPKFAGATRKAVRVRPTLLELLEFLAFNRPRHDRKDFDLFRRDIGASVVLVGGGDDRNYVRYVLDAEADGVHVVFLLARGYPFMRKAARVARVCVAEGRELTLYRAERSHDGNGARALVISLIVSSSFLAIGPCLGMPD